MPHLFAHHSRCLRSACSVRWSSSFLIILYSRQSSANKRTDELTQSGRSFIWHKNIIGLSTLQYLEALKSLLMFPLSFHPPLLFSLFWLIGSWLAMSECFLWCRIVLVSVEAYHVVLCRMLWRNLGWQFLYCLLSFYFIKHVYIHTIEW